MRQRLLKLIKRNPNVSPIVPNVETRQCLLKLIYDCLHLQLSPDVSDCYLFASLFSVEFINVLLIIFVCVLLNFSYGLSGSVHFGAVPYLRVDHAGVVPTNV